MRPDFCSWTYPCFVHSSGAPACWTPCACTAKVGRVPLCSYFRLPELLPPPHLPHVTCQARGVLHAPISGLFLDLFSGGVAGAGRGSLQPSLFLSLFLPTLADSLLPFLPSLLYSSPLHPLPTGGFHTTPSSPFSALPTAADLCPHRAIRLEMLTTSESGLGHTPPPHPPPPQ